MLLTEERREALKRAGYTAWIEFDVYLPISECWTRTGFPTVDKMIEDYRFALNVRKENGEVMNASFEAL